MAIPHFTTVESATNLGEPIFKNLFETTIIIPDAIQALFPDYTTVFLENTTDATLPEYQELEVVEQRYKYSTRLFLKPPAKTSMEDVSFKFNMNQNDDKQINTWRILKAWYDLAWNNEDGSLHYKKNIIGDIILHLHDKEGNIIRRVAYHNCQLRKLTGWDGSISWEDNDIVKDLEVSFACDYWEDFTY